MDWKSLESLVHDHTKKMGVEEVQKHSAEILQNIAADTMPLQAAKAAYVLVLLQLKASEMDESKALQFLQYLHTILEHEIKETQVRWGETSQTHLVYIYKLTEQYLHHLMMVAELAKAEQVLKKAQQLRKKNHDALLKVQNPLHSFWKKEQKMIQRAVTRHYVFAGFLLSIALYFSWTTLWELSDFAMSQWVYTEYSADSVSFLIREGLLLLFSISFVWGFVKYQGDES